MQHTSSAQQWGLVRGNAADSGSATGDDTGDLPQVTPVSVLQSLSWMLLLSVPAKTAGLDQNGFCSWKS